MTTTTNPGSATKAPRKADRSNGPGLLTGGRRSATSPQRPRTRSWGLITLAALLVVGLGLGVAAWGLQVGDKTSVLAIGQPVAKGQTIEREDLVTQSVAGVSDTIAVEDVDTVVGQTAAVDLVPGQILSPAMVAAEQVPGEGQSVLGLALDPTRVPSAGLVPGDEVDLIATPPAEGGGQGGDTALEAPEVLASGAEVFAVGGESSAGGQLLLTVVVDADDAAKIAAYSTSNRVAVVETALDREADASDEGTAGDGTGDGTSDGADGGDDGDGS